MTVIANQGLRVKVAPASDVDMFRAAGETFDAMALPLTDMLLRRLGGRAITVGDSWACFFTFGYIDAAGDFAAIDITDWALWWHVWDPITDELLFTRTAGSAIPDNPNSWKQIELTDPENGEALVRIDTTETLVTRGGMYRHAFALYNLLVDRTRQTFGGGPVEILPERPS